MIPITVPEGISLKNRCALPATDDTKVPPSAPRIIFRVKHIDISKSDTSTINQPITNNFLIILYRGRSYPRPLLLLFNKY